MSYVDDDEQKEFVDKEFTAREIDQMREAINDPTLPVEDRKNLLYALSNAGRLSDEEIDYYAEQVGADAEDVRKGGQAVHENMSNARASFDRVVSERESQAAAISDAYNSFNAGGFATSDEMIDQLEPVIGMFETYYPLYEQATRYVTVSPVPPSVDGASESSGSIFGDRGQGGAKAKYTHSGIDPESLRSGLQEFRGIDFSAFRADGEMLRQAYEAVSGHADALESSWKDNTDDWTGEAKDAAGQVNQGLSKAAETLIDGLSTAAEDLAAAADGLERFVADFGEEVIDVYHDGVILLPPNEVDAQIECMELLPDAIAYGESGAASGVFEDYEYWLPRQGLFIEHYWADDFIADCRTRLEAAEEKLKEFCEQYRARAARFHSAASRGVQTIDAGYAEMIQVIGSHIEPDPFKAMDVGSGGDGAPRTPTGPSGVPSGPGGAGGGFSGGGGGGMPPAGGGGVPNLDDLKPEGGSGINPVTNEPLEINPETGEPYPIDPVTGEPIKEADSGGGKLTVEQGGQKFTMTEPGEDGSMEIAVEGDSGELSEYKLDFGDADGEDAETSDDGGRREGFGPQGSDHGADKVYRPGPDGKIHIEDGDLKITAEQPDGPDGPTVVSVENGDGEPVTYTLGGEESSGTDEDISTRPTEAGTGQDPRNTAEPRETPQPPSGAGGGSPSFGEAGAGVSSASEPPSGGGAGAAGVEASAASVSSGAGADGLNEPSAAGQDSSATHAAAAVGGGGSAFGGGGGGEPLSDVEHEDHRGQSSPSGAGLGAAPGGEALNATPQGATSSASSPGGMGMMGGMGAMGGGGGGQGDDQERTSSAYRIDGDIFDLPFEAVRISGSLEGAPDVPVRFSR
jgi:uncharacterized protein YukE